MPALVLVTAFDTDARAYAIRGTTDLAMWQLEGVIRERDGRYFFGDRELADRDVLLRSTDGRWFEAVFYRDDDLERVLARDRYHRLTYDPLTGALTRNFLRSHMARIARPATVMAIDPDHMKRYNDVMGLLVGDALLRRVAQQILAQLRVGELAVRTGGEEFIAIGAFDRARAEALRAACREPITLSIALFPLPQTFDALLAAIDAQMSVAKLTRDCIVEV